MKNISLLLPLIWFAVSCHPSAKQHEEHQGHQHGHHADTVMSPTVSSDVSIYNVSSLWKNQHGDTLRLANLQGKVQVMAMMYASCQYTCPRILADMKAIEEMLGDDRKKVGMALVTIDPERDTPGNLKRFSLENDLDDWLLLHGGEDDIRELSALLGVQYKRTSNTDFSHSNILTVLSENGEVAYQQIGLGSGVEQTVARIKTALGHDM